ncbi:transposase [Microvirga sp. VF16]|uniref:transposase n=1 Tax=Microvirga sp. VF16 TaxID=2807101 RepID=UPI00193E4A91|nr:transposase [Microvirga sp. VF16]QRM33654.1 transposase [Microvirga sp. VF16]
MKPLKPDAILVMDNLRLHHATTVSELLARAAIGRVYLPRYSPEFNPVEHPWSKMKERLEAKAARSLETLEAELKPAFDTITAEDARAGSGTPAMLYTDPQFALEVDIELRKLTYMPPEHAHLRASRKLDAIERSPHKAPPLVSSCGTTI